MPCKISQELFGVTKDGKDVIRYTLSNSNKSLVVRIISYGASITEIRIPDRNGIVTDVALGFDDMAGYEGVCNYIGAIIGRVANRIAGGSFTIDGQTYQLFINNGPNTNHGGKAGFDKRLWTGSVEGDKLKMQYISEDGEEHFPGKLTSTVTFSVTDESELFVEYEATTTKTTPVNLTCHAFFNLAGHNFGNLDGHVATIHADKYVEVDKDSIPTGKTLPVEGTDLDLREPVKILDRLYRLPHGKGFDNTYCLTPPTDGVPKLAARVEHTPSGRYIECRTTEPALQFYTAFYLNSPGAKGGANYKQFGGFCLEAEHYPDSPNQPSFPNTILRPGETYTQTTVYKFGIV